MQLNLEFARTSAVIVAPTTPGLQFVIHQPLRPYCGARWRKPLFDGDMWLSFCPGPNCDGEDGHQ